MQNFLARFMPFLILGLMIVILIAGLVLLSYLLIFGALIGVVLFSAAWLKNKLFPSKDITTNPPKSGRTIDHDDL
ncbi:MAG: hypothetical protein P4M12_00415 [Gammaproteobacteria bacterium]|nr:hypothetical protein [Gammaproteobacteria bacterium]